MRLPLSGELATGARLVARLPGFLRRPLRPTDAELTVRARLREREANFSSVLREFVFERPRSPYAQLLQIAGCEWGDVESLLRIGGVEGTLRALQNRGVYLSLEEFKARTPVVRGSKQFTVDPALLLNPRTVAVMPRASSGSRGSRTLVPLDLDSIRDQAVDMCVGFAAHGGLNWAFAVWDVPGGAAIDKVLSTSAFGNPPQRWFSQIDPTLPALHPRYRWSAQLLRLVSLGAGRALPAPEYVSVDEPDVLLEWLRRSLAAGGTPCVRTYASSAVRLARAAAERGLSLRGVYFSLGGEPITEQRLDAIRRVGGQAHPTYGVIEAGPLGFGCAQPVAADDIHLFSDRLAIIQSSDQVAGALYLTSLLPSARVVLLNTALGDQAVVESRACGCPLAEIGWQTHLHTIRSYQKVTAAGMTFLDVDVIRALEEVLPARFGGGPADYQLVEEDAADGARACLLVHPRLGELDPQQVSDALLDALGNGSGAERIMQMVWRESRLIHVLREAPRTGSTGKVLHFHRQTVRT